MARSLVPASMPALSADPAGFPVDAGDMYFNTTTQSLRVYTGSAWVEAMPAGGGGAPSGPAGGDLAGTYPNPTLSSAVQTRIGTVEAWNAGTRLSALEASGKTVSMLTTNSIHNDTDQTAFPAGVSIMAITSSNYGYPNSLGTVATDKQGGSRVVQTFTNTTGGTWQRVWYTEWTPWRAINTDPLHHTERTNSTAVGYWYNIATLAGTDAGGASRAMADFEITCLNSGVHDFIRFSAGVSYAGPSASISLLDCVSYATQGPSISAIRIIAPSGTYGPVYLQVKASRAVSLTVRMKHLEFGTDFWTSSWTSGGTTDNRTDILNQVGVWGTGQPRNATLQNGWTNYDVNTYGYASYEMLPGSLVVLNGLVRNGTLGSDILTLPVGCRPKAVSIYTVGTGGGLAAGRIYVYGSGSVRAVAGEPAFFALDGIRFKAEQ